jgi:hypothetical protein
MRATRRALTEDDNRLAAIPTRSRIPRRARAVRPQLARLLSGMREHAPKDFCAMVTAWEANGFKGDVDEADALLDLFREMNEHKGAGRAMNRASKLLKRHGATRAERAAFEGLPAWPELREPAKDPVAELLMPGRDSSEGAGTREPWGAVSGADAG